MINGRNLGTVFASRNPHNYLVGIFYVIKAFNDTRETREGWPLLTVETQVNGDSKRTNERGPSLVGSLALL